MIRRLPFERVNEIFTIRYERKVRTDSTVQIDKVRYEVPAEFMNEKVQIYINPVNRGAAWLEDPYTKKRVPIHLLNKVENSVTKRRQNIKYPTNPHHDGGK